MNDIGLELWTFEEEEGIPHVKGPSFEKLFAPGKTASASSILLKNKAKARWNEDEAYIDELFAPVLKEWNSLLSRMKTKYRSYLGYEKPTSKKVPDELFPKLMSEKSIQAFNDKHLGYLNKPNTTLNHLYAYITLGAPTQNSITGFLNSLRGKFVNEKLRELREPFSEVLPEEFLSFFPPTMTINLDPQGQLDGLCSRFGNMMETLEVKHQKMLDLMAGQSQILANIQAGLMNPIGSLTHADATALSVLYETGIRPGGEGGIFIDPSSQRKVKRDAPGAVFFPTYGVTDLEVRHVTFSGGGAALQFPGKMSSINKAFVKEPRTVRSLKDYVEWAKADGVRRVLRVRDKSGVRNYEYADIRKAANKYDGLNPTDFRKYKATTATYDALKEQQADLYREIRSYAESPDVKVLIVKSIEKMVSGILRHAQQTLSHDDVETTIDAYLNPRVLLRFLATSSVESSLKKQVMSGDFVVKFDPVVFLKAALAAAGG